MEPEPKYVKIIRACALYVFPILIVLLLTIIFVVPVPKKHAPRTTQEINAEIQKLEAEKEKLQAH